MQPLHWGSFLCIGDSGRPDEKHVKISDKNQTALVPSALRLAQVTLGYKFEGLFGQC